MSRTGVQQLTPNDLGILVALQKQTLPDTLSARLGPSFNTLYHRVMLGETLYHCDGYFAAGMLVGYLSYTPNTVRLLRSALQHNTLAFTLTLVRSVVPNPRRWALAARIARSLFGGAPEPAPDVRAELLSIAVSPEYRGRRQASLPTVASTLLEHALARLRESGVASVKACVTPGDPVANAFYKKHGFQFRHAIQRYGLHAHLYVRELQPHASTEP